MKVLISGAGIAGPTLAFWLRKYGFAPTLVESAPALRTSGYVIDFWGLGYDIAEKMGLLPDIARIGYHMQELRIVDDCGRRLSGFGVQVFRQLTGGRYITLERSDLSKLIYDQISRSCEIIFGTASPVCARRRARCMSNSSMALSGTSISSSARTGFIPACANSSLARKTDTRRT
jgi:2-polyprenyl-6-methoxyphenol hydroxylase-like FAD-dependent oxidoreductase